MQLECIRIYWKISSISVIQSGYKEREYDSNNAIIIIEFLDSDKSTGCNNMFVCLSAGSYIRPA